MSTSITTLTPYDLFELCTLANQNADHDIRRGFDMLTDDEQQSLRYLLSVVFLNSTYPFKTPERFNRLAQKYVFMFDRIEATEGNNAALYGYYSGQWFNVFRLMENDIDGRFDSDFYIRCSAPNRGIFKCLRSDVQGWI